MNFARVVEVDEQASQTYGTGTQRWVALSAAAFPRTAAVAVNYRWYRLAKMEWEYRPKYNVFQESTTSTAAPSIPFIWTLRAKEMPDPPVDPLVGTGALQNLQECSAVMRRFNRRITLRYKPNTLISSETASQATLGPTQSYTPVWNRWYPTQQPNNTPGALPLITPVIYYGHYDYVDQDTKSPAAPLFDLFLRCTWEFKEPMLSNNITPPDG